jgi:hypothetical protein
MGGTKAAYMTSKGSLMVDEDAGKKSVTDGMVKCLSMIGFAGDIFSGQWDDSKYVAWADQQYASKETGTVQKLKLAALSGAGDDLPEDEKTYLREVAEYIKGVVQSGDTELAIKKYLEYRLDDSQTMYVDSLLDSKTRSAIRKQFTQKAA